MRDFKLHKIGEVSSKYGYQPELFERDIAKHKFDAELFKAKVRNLLLEEPSKIDIRYSQMIEVLREVKEEFRL